jgi:hypothetical protein
MQGTIEAVQKDDNDGRISILGEISTLLLSAINPSDTRGVDIRALAVSDTIHWY